MRSRLAMAPVIALLICLLIAAAASSRNLRTRSRAETGAQDGEVEYVTGEVLVKFMPGVSEHTVAEINSSLGTEVISVHRAGVRRLKVPAGRPEQEIIEILGEDLHVEYAELNSICRAFTTPNDPAYSYQWHFPAVNAPSAWEISAGSGIVVAILDTGIAYEDYPIPAHELNTVREGITQYCRAPDMAGTSFVPGYDFVNDDSHPNDNAAHGTHVAGTVAQTTNNRLGAAGLAFDCSLMPVKVLDYSGSGSASELADGIYWATDNGAQVINMSLGWPPGYDPGATVHNAVEYAYDHGVVLVASSGNWGTGTVSYPAAYPEVIAVGATRYDSELTDYSQYGTQQELVAPGGDVELDQNSDGEVDGVLQQTFEGHDYGPPEVLADPTDFGYYFYDGTSMAAPHVTALVALMMADGQILADSIRIVLHETAVDLGDAGWDERYGHGLIDAYGALTYTSGGCGGVHAEEADGGQHDPPAPLEVGDNHPDPFRCTTRFTVSLESPVRTRIAVYNILGHRITALAEGNLEAGDHVLTWDGTNDRGDPVPSGIYFYQVQAPDQTVTRKMVLAR